MKVLLNETPINAVNLHAEMIMDKGTNRKMHKIGFNFTVRSSMYHDITTLLYTNDFEVKVPEKNLEFRASIYNYSTSITNLYKENEVGEFHLELVERV